MTDAVGHLRDLMGRHGQTNVDVALHGAGPHYCPGGNPTPKTLAGATPFSTGSISLYRAIVGIRHTGGTLLSSLHGSAVGGGVAYSLSTTFRVAASSTSISFGNLSRGAVPGMHLSRTLPRAGTLSSSLAMYLSAAICDKCIACYRSGAFPTAARAVLSNVSSDRARRSTRFMHAVPGCSLAWLHCTPRAVTTNTLTT